MTQSAAGEDGLARMLRVDAACLSFEDAWQAGRAPRLLDHLVPADGGERAALLRELLRVEVYYRRLNGEWPTPADYLRQLPDDGETILSVFAQDQTVPQAARGVQPAWPTLPNYRILGVLGKGGMGVVYKAEQENPRRVVALKTIRHLDSDDPEQARRFRREVEALARLEHPHFVRVYEAGEADGVPFYSMEYVAGGSLAQRLAAGAMPPRQAAELVITLARAVHTAHERGVVHRDLKPANVLLSSAGPARAADLPRITDFGLARCHDAQSQTQDGAVLGTPSYMAPEQASGELSAVGPRTDVYGLGAILYEALTGRPPFRAETRDETLRQVRSREPDPPSRCAPRLCRSLEAVCLKCLEKDASRRYASAAELAEDLGRWLDDRPTLARPGGLLGRIGKATRRRPGFAAAVACTALAAVAAASLWAVQDPGPERRYRRTVAPSLAKLKEGEAVELIRPAGPAPAVRIRCGEGIVKARMTEEGFVVTTPVMGIVEFLPDVPCPRYRVLAEFRHDPSRFGPVGNGGVGIVFSYCGVDSPVGKQHVFGAVALNDWDKRDRGGPLPKSRAMLQLVWFLDTSTDAQSPFEYQIRFPPKREVWYVPPERPQGGWHSLTIDVTPEKKSATLSDCPEQRMGPFSPELFDTFPDRVRAARAEAKGVDFPAVDRPAVAAVVSGGQMTLRRLRIEPQKNPN